jgi:hypothetical protein
MNAGSVLSGSESEVREGLQRLLDLGAREILVSIGHAGKHRQALIDRRRRGYWLRHRNR